MKIKTNKVSFVLMINIVANAKNNSGSLQQSSKIEKMNLHFVNIAKHTRHNISFLFQKVRDRQFYDFIIH
jgi:hypothetical protein